MSYWYFIISLMFSIIITILLFIFLIKRLSINWARQNRHKYSCIIPAFVTLLLVAFCLWEVRPRVLDAIEMLNGGTHNFNIDTSETKISGRKLEYGESTYFLIPGLSALEDNTLYRVKSAPRSSIILEIEKLPTPNQD